MTDRERLDQIEDYWLDGSGAILDADISWLIGLARRLLAVEEAARKVDEEHEAEMAAAIGTAERLHDALADLDEWRKEQP